MTSLLATQDTEHAKQPNATPEARTAVAPTMAPEEAIPQVKNGDDGARP